MSGDLKGSSSSTQKFRELLDEIEEICGKIAQRHEREEKAFEDINL
jgi:hypothetical protein